MDLIIIFISFYLNFCVFSRETPVFGRKKTLFFARFLSYISVGRNFFHSLPFRSLTLILPKSVCHFNFHCPVTCYFCFFFFVSPNKMCKENHFFHSLVVSKPEPEENQVQNVSPSSSTIEKSVLTMNTDSFANSKFVTANHLNDNTFMQLEETTPLFGEIFNELILPENYCTLLSDEIQPIDSQGGKINIVDDFINYSDGVDGATEKSSNILKADNLSKVTKPKP